MISFLCLNFSGLVKLTSFHLFQKQLSDSYCINKENSKMNCQGKCFLKKILDEENKQQQESLPDFQKTEYLLTSAFWKFTETSVDLVSSKVLPYNERIQAVLLNSSSPPPEAA